MSEDGLVRGLDPSFVTRRSVGVAVAAVLLVAMLAAPAAAHVEVEPVEGQEARVGEMVTVAVRVPNERSVGTERFELFFPEPIDQVTVAPTPGWVVTAETSSDETPAESLSEPSSVPIVPVHEGDDHADEPAPEEPSAAQSEAFTDVSALIWQGGPLGADEVVNFVMTLGPLPDLPELVFKATQTYEDGEVVRWAEEPVAGAAEPESPAPTLELAGATTEASTTTTRVAASTAAEQPSDRGGSDWWRTVLIGVAAALVVGGVAARLVVQRRFRRDSSRS